MYLGCLYQHNMYCRDLNVSFVMKLTSREALLEVPIIGGNLQSSVSGSSQSVLPEGCIYSKSMFVFVDYFHYLHGTSVSVPNMQSHHTHTGEAFA